MLFKSVFTADILLKMELKHAVMIRFELVLFSINRSFAFVESNNPTPFELQFELPQYIKIWMIGPHYRVLILGLPISPLCMEAKSL